MILNSYHSIVWGTKTSFPLILTIIYPSILFFFLFINFSFTSLSFSYCMASSFSLAAIISFVTSPAVLNAMHQQQHPIMIRKTTTTINTIRITIPLSISEPKAVMRSEKLVIYARIKLVPLTPLVWAGSCACISIGSSMVLILLLISYLFLMLIE